MSLLNLEKGYLFSLKQLIIRPGKIIAEFIDVNRSRLTKPILYLTFSAFIFIIINNLTNTDFAFFKFVNIEIGSKSYGIEKFTEWLNENVIYANLVIGLFILIWTKIFFYNSRYNIYEIAILTIYNLGTGLVIIAFLTAVVHLAERFFTINIKSLFLQYTYVVYLLYLIYGLSSFFAQKKNKAHSTISMFLAIGSVLTGIFSYFLTLIIISIIYGIFK